jgi:ATP-binding cassette subfamily G (WHITE) protein 2 (SNQ2)
VPRVLASLLVRPDLSLVGSRLTRGFAVLSVLAGRSDGVMKGTVLVDGRAPSEEFYRTTGLVDQFDLHDDRATVREALEFSALLRQNSSIPLAEKLAYVDVVLNLLDLAHLEDAIIGSPSAGLNPEQRKRLSIAVEVVSRPVILFCDEPTTGLDSKSALRVVKLLRRLARSGLAVVATIHQPSAEAFEMFDSLLLLQRGGKQVYFGPRALAVDFFSSYGVLPKNANPADFLLEAAGAGVGVPDERLETLDDLDILPQQWTSSPEFIFLHTTIGSLSDPSHFKTRHATSSATTYQQCYELTKRVSRNFYRDRHSYTKLFTATLVSLLIGLSFFQLGHTVVSLQNRLFSVFLILFVPPVFMNLAIFKMISLRALWEARERPGKIYGRTAFVTSLVLSELPYSIVCAAVYFTIWYTLGEFLSYLPSGYSLIVRVCSWIPIRRKYDLLQFVPVSSLLDNSLTSISRQPLRWCSSSSSSCRPGQCGSQPSLPPSESSPTSSPSSSPPWKPSTELSCESSPLRRKD